MSEWKVTPWRICLAVIGILGFLLLPFGDTAARLGRWLIDRRNAY